MIDEVLFRQNYDNVLQRSLEKLDVERVLSEVQDGQMGGNFGGDIITHKILWSGYYFPTLFKDAHAYAKNGEAC